MTATLSSIVRMVINIIIGLSSTETKATNHQQLSRVIAAPWIMSKTGRELTITGTTIMMVTWTTIMPITGITIMTITRTTRMAITGTTMTTMIRMTSIMAKIFLLLVTDAELARGFYDNYSTSW